MIIEKGYAITLSMQGVQHKMGCQMNIDDPNSNHEQFLHPNITFLFEDVRGMEIFVAKLQHIQISLREMISKIKRGEKV